MPSLPISPMVFLCSTMPSYAIESPGQTRCHSRGARRPEVEVTKEANRGKETLREIDEKYVSFSAIDELERAEVADSATEPFRDDEES